jgi:hypothetical protein
MGWRHHVHPLAHWLRLLGGTDRWLVSESRWLCRVINDALEDAVFSGRVAGNRFFEEAKEAARDNSEAFTYCLFGGACLGRSVDLARAKGVPAVGQS